MVDLLAEQTKQTHLRSSQVLVKYELRGCRSVPPQPGAGAGSSARGWVRQMNTQSPAAYPYPLPPQYLSRQLHKFSLTVQLQRGGTIDFLDETGATYTYLGTGLHVTIKLK